MPITNVPASTSIDGLFNTQPTVPAAPAKPITLDQGLKVQLLGAIQTARAANHGYPPPNLDDTKVQALRSAVDNGQAVFAALTGDINVYLKKAEADSPSSFFYRTSGGFAGLQYYGPIDV